MPFATIHTSIYLLIISLLMATSCIVKSEQYIESNAVNEAQTALLSDPQIAEYIRHIFQDKNGHFWFGTNGYGIAHYNGDSISYYSHAHGFEGQQITGITADQDQNIWFATDSGIVKYDFAIDDQGQKQFNNFTASDYFEGQRFWSIFADSKGHIWAGAVAGIYQYDGKEWKPFHLPYLDLVTGEFITDATTMSIAEDQDGNMWFSTMGYGAFKYNGKQFTQYTKNDGLSDNSIDHIMQDRHGDMWFGTRFGGISKYDGTNFTTYSQKDDVIGNDEVCVIYEDSDGNIWFSSEGFGVYRYDPKADHSEGVFFTNFSANQGLHVRAVQTIYEDQDGHIWVGGGGGLYRYDDTSLPVRPAGFVNIKKDGPWK